MSRTEQTSVEPAFAQVERPDPIIRADAMAYVMFERRDVTEMTRFLIDFGLVPLDYPGEVSYFRGYGTAPWLVALRPAAEDRFAGFGMRVRTEADLEQLAAAAGAKVDLAEGPGGGRRVRLNDPDGLIVDAVYGATPLAPLPTRATSLPANTPENHARINVCVRTPVAPSPIFRLGHVVLQRLDFARSAAWYMRHFGLIPSDIQALPNGQPALGFFRFDRDAAPADHHSVAILGGPATSLLHTSFETFDIESVGQGHQHLRAQGWTPYWGIGRHHLGSQLFDYWKDPVGDEWEHYADGDVFDAGQPTGYHWLARGALWTWGDDLPDSMRPDMRIEDIPAIHAAGGFGELDLSSATELMKALLVKPRPWMK